MKTNPQRIKLRRQRLGYTQADLAALVGCTQQYISMLESGVDVDCSERIALRICKRLDVDLEDIFEEREIYVQRIRYKLQGCTQARTEHVPEVRGLTQEHASAHPSNVHASSTATRRPAASHARRYGSRRRWSATSSVDVGTDM